VDHLANPSRGAMLRGRIVAFLLCPAVFAVQRGTSLAPATQRPGLSHLEETAARRRRRRRRSSSKSSAKDGQTSPSQAEIDTLKKELKGIREEIAGAKESMSKTITDMKVAVQEAYNTLGLSPPSSALNNTALPAGEKPPGKLLRSRYTPMDYHRNMCIADTGDGYLTMRNCSFDDASQLWTIGSGEALQNAKTGKCMTTSEKKICGT